jgi:hypothetical protein
MILYYFLRWPSLHLPCCTSYHLFLYIHYMNVVFTPFTAVMIFLQHHSLPLSPPQHITRLMPVYEQPSAVSSHHFMAFIAAPSPSMPCSLPSLHFQHIYTLYSLYLLLLQRQRTNTHHYCIAISAALTFQQPIIASSLATTHILPAVSLYPCPVSTVLL